MVPGETVCRAAVHPKYFKDELFDKAALLGFARSKSLDIYVSSVASLQACGDEAGVHEYGKNVAESLNNRELVKLEKNKNYELKKNFYLGYYTAKTERIVSVAGDFHRTEVNWRPENGLDEHFQIELCPQVEGRPRGELQSDRHAMITQICDMLNGPVLCPAARRDPELAELQVASLPIIFER